ncbi:MAG: DUF885 domain-containing protein [Gemmatimonadota bacterium]
MIRPLLTGVLAALTTLLTACGTGSDEAQTAARDVKGASAAAAYGTSSPTSREFAALVDEYLDGWAAFYPSIAGGNGLHMHDDRLEDFSAANIARQLAWFRDMKGRLERIPSSALTPDERVDHRILDGVIDGWILDLDVARSWERNPMIYAAAIADGVHNLMTMASAAPEVRMLRVRDKLRGVPVLLDAARANLKNPPRILAERGLGMFQGASAMLGHDLALALDAPRGEAWDAMMGEATAAQKAIDAFIAEYQRTILPNANGTIALGRDYVEARYRAEELIDLPAPRMLEIAARELTLEQALFVEKARAVDSTRTAMDVWRDVLRDHPQRGELVAATRRVVDELQQFVTSQGLVRLPSDDRVIVEPSLPFDIGLASMHASPPMETAPVKSIYYVTDASADWTLDRQNKWLERFNYPSLAITSAHEAMPGHFVHSLFMRSTPGKIRRIWIGLNPFPQPSSGQDGWAHYAEHLVIEQGFKREDPRYAMAQLSESMTRICRLIVSLNVHTNGWTIEQGAKYFEENAHVPGPAAMQEATRVAYDPTNGGYFLGKRALLTLREDVTTRSGAAFNLREFHEQVMRNGIAPWWAHRQLLLPGDTGAVIR